MCKRLWVLLVAILILIGACGCMRTNRDAVKKPSEQEYTELMRKHMEEKYDTTFTVVDAIFPEDGFNAGMQENVLIIKDPNGVVTNVEARLGKPYSYYDDYIECLAADQIQKSLDLSELEKIGNGRVYAVVNATAVSELSVAPEDVRSVGLVVNIPAQPDDAAMDILYDVYGRICGAGYKNFYMIVWFTDGNAEFDRAVEHYRVYGKSKWTEYSGTVYAAMKVTDPDLSYEMFRAALNEN